MSKKNPNVSVFRYCPGCGSGDLNAKDCKSFFCNSCGFSFYLNAAAAVAVLIFDKYHQLLVTIRDHEPAAGTFDLPGGFADPGEKIEETVIREIKEELNLEVMDMEYLFSEPNTYLFEGISYDTLDMVFLCQVEDFSSIKPADDVRSVEFFPLNDLDVSRFGFLSIRNVIKRYMQTKTNNN